MTQQSLFADELAAGEYLVPTKAATVCASCKAAIVWTRTPAGAAVPLSVATARRLVDGRMVARTHFADCPHARAWRKRGAK